MNKKIVAISILIASVLMYVLIAHSKQVEEVIPTIDVAPLSDKEIISIYLLMYSEQYNVSYSEMYNTMKCESSLNPNAINDTHREYSVGIAQINLDAHTYVTVDQAKDIQFSIEFMAKEFSNGNQKIWTCWRNIYLK